MKTSHVCEPSTHFYEEDIAHRWWTLPPGTLLPLSNGAAYQLVFAGRSGGAVGPDVRDAVVRRGVGALSGACGARINSLAPLPAPSESDWGQHHVGDIEFHVRASDWFTHQHHSDARYNNVILHVVLILDDPRPTLRQNGTTIPTCSLYDLPHTTHLAATWPCHYVMQHMSAAERSSLLKHAGVLRFEQKTQAFVELLRTSQPQGPFSAYDACLIPALAEGLGYGRDRAFFRAAGLYLLGLAEIAPEPLGRTPDPPPLDAQRLRTLRNLVAKWRICGAWQTLREAALSDSSDISTTTQALRAMFSELSTARSDILICNVVLPFAAAIALIEQDRVLAEQSQMLYITYPSLSSNQITRSMSKQLQLNTEPQGACQQQGLHYIHQQTCREKLCGQCIAGKRDIDSTRR